MIPLVILPFFQIHKSHGIGYGMSSVGTPASKKLGAIVLSRSDQYHRLKKLALKVGT
jgi:hypothetical protein